MLRIWSILFASQCIIISKILSRSTTLSFICAEFQNFSIYFEYIMMPVFFTKHYSDVITSMMVCQITGVSIVYSTICSGRSKKTSKLCITGLCGGNSPVNSPHTRASNAKNVSFWWCHHGYLLRPITAFTPPSATKDTTSVSHAMLDVINLSPAGGPFTVCPVLSQ